MQFKDLDTCMQYYYTMYTIEYCAKWFVFFSCLAIEGKLTQGSSEGAEPPTKKIKIERESERNKVSLTFSN